MVYANDSKSFDRKVVWVQVPPPAQSEAMGRKRVTCVTRAVGLEEVEYIFAQLWLEENTTPVLRS